MCSASGPLCPSGPRGRVPTATNEIYPGGLRVAVRLRLLSAALYGELKRPFFVALDQYDQQHGVVGKLVRTFDLVDRFARVETQDLGGGKILDAPGEQIVTSDSDGTVRIYACPDAEDTPAAKARYANPYYAACLRIWAMASSRVNLGGL